MFESGANYLLLNSTFHDTHVLQYEEGESGNTLGSCIFVGFLPSCDNTRVDSGYIKIYLPLLSQ